MGRRFLCLLSILFLGFVLVTATMAVAAASSLPRHLRGRRGQGWEEEDEEPDGGWEFDETDSYADAHDQRDDNDDSMKVWSAYFANAEDMDREEPPSTAATTQQQTGPPASVLAPPGTNKRWISYNDEDLDPTLYFAGDVKPSWESVDGEIRLNGRPFHLKGISWFGFETDTRWVRLYNFVNPSVYRRLMHFSSHIRFAHSVLHGLDSHGTDFYLDLLRKHGFNLLRIPISLAVALNLDSRPRYSYFADPSFRGKTVGQLLQVRQARALLRH